MKRILILTAMTAALGVAAFAEPPRPDDWHARVRQGVRSGELTQPELARLRAENSQLRRQVVRSKNDGPGITRPEAARIRANAKQNNNLLHRLKHNQRAR